MLLDTSGLVACHDRSDARHADAAAIFAEAPIRITHNYVLAEMIPVCQVRGLNRARTLAFVADLLDSPLVTVEWVDIELHRDGVAFLKSRPDKVYSLCDAVSFILMRRHGVHDALTADRDFEREGFVRLLRP